MNGPAVGQRKSWGYWDQTIIGELRTACHKPNPKNEATKVLLSMFRDVDKNYGLTVANAGRRVAKGGFKEIDTRRDVHKAAKTAAAEAAKAYESADDATWTWAENCLDDLKSLLEAESEALDVVNTKIQALFELDVIYRIRSGRESAWNQEQKLQTQSHVMRHNATTYQADLYQRVAEQQEALGKGARLPVDLYIAVKGFQGRAERELAIGCEVITAVRNKLEETVAGQAFMVVADKAGSGAQKAIERAKVAVEQAQAATEITAVVVPVETVAKVLEAANSIGQICQNVIFNAAEEYVLRREAKAIADDPAKRQLAIQALTANPLMVAEYAAKQNAKELKQALDMAHPAVAGILMGVAASVEWSGVAVIVTKTVFPWIWPVITTVVREFFGKADGLAIDAARIKLEEQRDFMDGGAIDLKAVEKVARNVGLAAYKEMRSGLMGDKTAIIAKIRTAAAQDTETIENIAATGNKELAKISRAAQKKAKKGLGNVTPDGIVEFLAAPVSKIVDQILKKLPAEPAELFTGAQLLAAVKDLGQETRFEQMQAARTAAN